MWIRIILVVVTVCAMTPSKPYSESQGGTLGAYGAELWRASVASLNGKTHMGFLVLEGAREPIVSGDIYSKLRTHLSEKLSKVGIKVLGFSEAAACHDSIPLGCASLNMLFHILDDGRGGYILEGHLTFDQRVRLANERSMMATTIDYSYTRFGPASDLFVDLGELGEQCIDDFVRDYLFANQEGYWKKHDSIRDEVGKVLGW